MDGTTGMGSGGMGGGGMEPSGTGGSGGGGLDGVMRAVDQALTSLDPQAGASAIGQVLQALQGAPGIGGIAGTLQQLQQQLSGGAPDGAQTGRLLTTASRQTRELAGQAGELSGPLQQLAQRLEAAGSQLSGSRA